MANTFYDTHLLAKGIIEMTWKLANQAAELNLEGLTGKVELRKTVNGLNHITFQNATLGGWNLMGFDASPGSAPNAPELLQEVYTRGDDLIATFAEDPTRHVRPQAYWRMCGGDNIVAIELVLSMQTSTLDSDPLVEVCSKLGGPAEAPFCIDAMTGEPTSQQYNTVIWRPGGMSWTYVETTFPSDHAGFTAKRNGLGIEVTRRMFPARLEKGVIRRGRIMAMFVPRADDVKHASHAIQQWVEMPPPLAT